MIKWAALYWWQRLYYVYAFTQERCSRTVVMFCLKDYFRLPVFFFTYVCETYSGTIRGSHCICMYFSEQREFHSNFEQFLMDLKTMQGRIMVVIFVKICKHSISFTYMYFALFSLLKINQFRCTYSCEGWGRCLSFWNHQILFRLSLMDYLAWARVSTRLLSIYSMLWYIVTTSS